MKQCVRCKHWEPTLCGEVCFTCADELYQEVIAEECYARYEAEKGKDAVETEAF